LFALHEWPGSAFAIPGDDFDFVPEDPLEGLFNYEANFADKLDPLPSAIPVIPLNLLSTNRPSDENRFGASVGFTGREIRATATAAGKSVGMNYRHERR
jgi:hypothetical protein